MSLPTRIEIAHIALTTSGSAVRRHRMGSSVGSWEFWTGLQRSDLHLLGGLIPGIELTEPVFDEDKGRTWD